MYEYTPLDDIQTARSPFNEPGHFNLRTTSGVIVNLLDITSDGFDLTDAVWALCVNVRFAGNTKYRYAIGQHSVNAYRAVKLIHPDRYDLQFEALFHDIVEGVTGDIVTMLKRVSREFHQFLEDTENRVHQIVEIPVIMSSEVKSVDRILFDIEARALQFNLSQEPDDMVVSELNDGGISFDEFRSIIDLSRKTEEEVFHDFVVCARELQAHGYESGLRYA